MPAYVIAQVDIRNPEAYERYRDIVPDTIAKHGGRYLARGGACETLEGSWMPRRLVILEFPDADRARAWWNSPDYAEAKALRQANADTELLLVEGLPAPALPRG